MIWDGSAYVEQARIVRRLWRWRCGRVAGRELERGIAGGLDGEARSAFGEQELKVITRSVSTTPRTSVSVREEEIHVTSFFHCDLALDRDHRTLDQVCRA